MGTKRSLDEIQNKGKYKIKLPTPAAPPAAPPPPAQPPLQYNPQNYEQQLAGQLSPGFQSPPIQGQFPMNPQMPMGQQPGFGQSQFNPNIGLFGSFAPQGGMFSGMFGGQQ